MKQQAKRGRNFATIIYQESCVPDFQSKISDWHIQAYLSPLHDKDCTESGELKKPHWHLLVKFDGCKSEKQVKEYFDSIGAVGVEFVGSFRSYARYLCHLDEDEDSNKYKYDPGDVIAFSEVSYDELIKSSDDVMDILSDIEDFIESYDITLFHELLRYCKDNRPQWAKILRSGYTTYFSAYLKSKEYGRTHHDLYKIYLNDHSNKVRLE